MSKRPWIIRDIPESPKSHDPRLIAAAPEMLAMLKRLATISTMDYDWDQELQDLIAKVEGRE